MSIGERIRSIREELKMSRSAFGDTLGISGDTVNNLERDRLKTTSDAILKLICKTHRVNYFWLTEGIGDPYVGVPEIIIEDAIEEYGLDELDKKIVEEYVKLPAETRNALRQYINSVFKNAPD